MGMSEFESNLSRRRYLGGLVAAGGTAALSACVEELDGGDGGGRDVPRGEPEKRPRRQHAWKAVLDTDEHGNTNRPSHHVLVGLDLRENPGEGDRETVESAFRSLESAYGYDPEGLLFTVGYGPEYFRQVGVEPPIPEPRALTGTEDPEFDEFDAMVHLASEHPDVVLEAEEALFGAVSEPNGVEMTATLEEVFERGEPRRTGFVGAGLPAEKADAVGGVPDEMPDEAPFFMGFDSGFAGSQASEDRVTIDSGPYEGGTTTHVESLDLQLDVWFEQDNQFQRVAKMFSPAHAEQESVGEMGEKLGSSTGAVNEDPGSDARTEGIVGHAQKAARARDEDGRPLLLRRDFNTVDGGEPGVHFLAHQRTIDAFVRTRQAMAGEDLAGEGVGQRLNNGILQYIFVRRRGNYLVPPRDRRALPEL